MKNLLGIFFPPSTCAELGKNGPCGPSPSASMEAGGIAGFSMVRLFCQRDWRMYQAPADRPTSTRRHTRARPTATAVLEPARPLHQLANAIPTPPTESTTCAYNEFQCDRGVPVWISHKPITAPAKSKSQASADPSSPSRHAAPQ